MNDERERLLGVSGARELRGERAPAYFGFEEAAQVQRVHERFAVTLRLLTRHGLRSLTGLRILDVGCGEGTQLRQLVQWGASPGSLAGIDLREGAVERARALGPAMDLRVGSAESLPWPDASFDLVCQQTVFTSILDGGMRRRVAAEMARVLKPGGAVLWYDFVYDNPRNADVRRVPPGEVRALFPGFAAHLVRVTLAPPIARRIPAAALPLLYPLLAALPFLRTHRLGLLVKPR